MKTKGVLVKAALALCSCLGIAFGVVLDCSQYPGVVGEDGTISVACPRIFEPVCGTDGITYNHECEICSYNQDHNTSVKKAHDGKCKSEPNTLNCREFAGVVNEDGTISVACPRIFKPVCSTDGVTYSHECEICSYNQDHNTSVKKAHDGKCKPEPTTIDCSRYRRTEIDGHVLVACPRILKPVCGSDGFTYNSECVICAHNTEHQTNISKIHDGECEQVATVDCNYPTIIKDGEVLVSCPRNLSPVCGTDGITYDNECGICAHNGKHGTHVGKKHDGECRQETSEIDCSQYPSVVKDGKALLICPRILLPVCGTDGFTYENECGICAHNLEHRTDVKKSHKGRCNEESPPVDCNTYLRHTENGKTVAACPLILREICGTDGVTYDNDCALCAHNAEFGTNVAKKHSGRCTEEVHQLDCSRYPTSTLRSGKQLVACTMIYDPVCGTDGITYASECTLCAHNLLHQTNLGKRKNGRCEEDITREHCKGIEEVSPICTLENRPHCGSDGKTYSNRCLFCNAYLESNRTLNLVSMTEC